MSEKVKLAILQRVCTNYRIPLFSSLNVHEDIESLLFIGEDLPNSKVRNSRNLAKVEHKKLKTRFVKFGRRMFPWHVGLIGELRKYKPEVILCEGESHFLGYLQAIWYKLLFNRKVALIHWCFISLPGEEDRIDSFAFKIKKFFRRYFDAFLLYSSFSKKRLVAMGEAPEKAFVATNVGDIRKFIEMSDSLSLTKEEAKDRLNISGRFNVIYVGTLDQNKRPELLVELAKICPSNKFNFVLLGDGPMKEELREQVASLGLRNVLIAGRVIDELALYYRSSDVLLIPGRGGIVISEAMAFGIPVVVSKADGTEYDLVKNKITGIHLDNDDLISFKKAIDFLADNKEVSDEMGKESRKMVETEFTTEKMVEHMIAATRYARTNRKNNN
ncbi:glycosyltransferase family 4 protein [uncultured Roseivirga sp.]|uniref:glycosyltransferase family 4 protein n=1 Tax=uncultured Roseivirga sp. TaxID=543088 RepID=UPI0030D8DADE|tara:strand:- start:88956 stop:90113 length:1158 start_codon:yes stop_codon:yes gene_type:complete